MVVGGAGGQKITSSVSYLLTEHYVKKKSLTEAMNNKRFHHQLSPMAIQYEAGYNATIIEELKNDFMHSVIEVPSEKGFAALIGLSCVENKIDAAFDPRRGGSSEIWEL
jgi:gamma-glutamyltranspeptidase/glutathione hydrolase/leukotriene-C4 hydrolase